MSDCRGASPPFSLCVFPTGSCGRGAGRGTKSSLKCWKSATGQRGRAETSTRSTPNSGSCLIRTFATLLSFVCLCCVETTFMCYVCRISFELCVSHFFRVSLWLSFHPPPSLPPRIFSHPNVLPMLGACQSPPAPHPIIITHWMPYGSLYNVLHEGTSEYFDSEDSVLSLAAELKVCLSGLTFVSRPPVRLCRGPDAGREVCPGHCLWNGLPTHAWTNDPSSLSQQQECDGENQNSS